MKKIVLIVILIAMGYAGLTQYRDRIASGRGSLVEAVFGNFARIGASGEQLQGKGKVIKILPDDDEGRRHQKFILELDSGQTLLIAHNIDRAPRIATLQTGDEVAFFGQYEWNSQGGVVHWTHSDPSGRHVGGWLKHEGMRYD